MTRQEKIDHMERKGYKVKCIYSSATPQGRVSVTSPSGNTTIKDSVNQAHQLVFGY